MAGARSWRSVFSDIVNGDKRILMIDGVPVPYALARIPAIGESRATLPPVATASLNPYPIGILWICQQVSTLKKKGLLFVSGRDWRLPHRDQRDQPDLHTRD